ncbi:hypothetical protein RSP03_14210 [Cereibacter sphaeroides]|jgi:hypothetical protein|nr:hypothetical protein RSP03_14210 [Cereibacter sphaeroides]
MARIARGAVEGIGLHAFKLCYHRLIRADGRLIHPAKDPSCERYADTKPMGGPCRPIAWSFSFGVLPMLFKLGHGQNIRIYPRSRSLRGGG